MYKHQIGRDRWIQLEEKSSTRYCIVHTTDYITGYECLDTHIISKWSEKRVWGNTFMQVIHALSSCLTSNTPLIFPSHELLTHNVIIPNVDIDIGGHHLWGYFFYGFFDLTNQYKREITQKYILPIVKLPTVEVKKHTIIIHIRSGDMFQSELIDVGGLATTNSGNKFAQPNQFYYDTILQNNVFEHVLVVTQQDMVNPMVAYLKETYNAEIQATTSENDFATLVNAENLVAGNSTFSLIPLYLSTTLKRYWFPCFMLPIPLVTLFLGDVVPGIEMNKINMCPDVSE